MWLALLQIPILLVSPLLQLLMGELILEKGLDLLLSPEEANPFFERRAKSPFWMCYYVIGLGVYLTTILLLGYFPLPFVVNCLLAYLPGCFCLPRVKHWWNAINIQPSANFVFWFLVVVALGVSLFSGVESIATPWVNNYGDLTWHVGMITSFVFGQNFPPEYHIFPGVSLSYPFLCNLWTASLWVFHPTYPGLSQIFLYQWVILWTLVYYALHGNRFRVLPWALLFGGGAYVIISRLLGYSPTQEVADAGVFAHQLIDKGYPWVPFLTTIWVTQRPALFGIAGLLVSLALFHKHFLMILDADSEAELSLAEKRALLASFLVLSVLPLFHTHSFITVVSYVGLSLFWGIISTRKNQRAQLFRAVKLFIVGILPAVCFLPWVLGKASIFRWSIAWMQADVYKNEGAVIAVKKGIALWLQNGLPCLAVFAVLVIAGRVSRNALALGAVFLLGNIVQLAIWNWDQIKVFLALYACMLSLWCGAERSWSEKPRELVFYVHWVLLAVMVPALGELWIVLRDYKESTVYSTQDIKFADAIRNITPPHAIIVGAPDHNSLVTLTGRRLFYGYEGTLGSHALDFGARRIDTMDINRLIECRQVATKFPKLCPDYLLWTTREQQYWKKNTPDPRLVPTELPYLYKLPD